MTDIVFPQPTFDAYGKGDWTPYGGLTRRELFAAMAMQGMLSAEAAAQPDQQMYAEDAVKFADALIKALGE